MSSKEKNLGLFQIGLVVGDEYFNTKIERKYIDLEPVIHSLLSECKGLIKQPGIYAFRLQVNKLK